MPIVNVEINLTARATYLGVYKQQAKDKIDVHLKTIWDVKSTMKPWEEMVFHHRATQAYAYLNDPDGDTNIARYPLIEVGVPYYGSDRESVAESYLYYFNAVAVSMASLYEDHRLALEYISTQPDKPQVDTLVNDFIGGHPIP